MSDTIQSATDRSDVYLVRGTDGTDDGVQRLIALMGLDGLGLYQTSEQPDGLIAQDDVVLIKVNCQWAERGGTNTDLLAKVAQAIAEHPQGFTGEVVIADNGQGQYGTQNRGGSMGWGQANSADRKTSVADVVEALSSQMRISATLWDDITTNRVGEYSTGDTEDGFVVDDVRQPTGLEISYPKFMTKHGTCISLKQGVWDVARGSYQHDRLKVINLPVLKVHFIYQVTGAVKAYMGTTSCKLTNQAAHNSVGSGGMGSQMALTRMPTINIIDMIWVGANRGPNTGYSDAIECNAIAASTDPVALDWWCAKNVLMPLVAERGSATASLDPDADTPGSFGRWLGLSADVLAAAGFSANRGAAVRLVQ
jgi:uncharacterized protein (DUF362 family)